MKRAACILYQRDDGKILAVNRFNKSGIEKDYGLPGGKLEPGERPTIAAIRECQEETGIIVDAFFGTPYEAVDARDGYRTSTYHALTLTNDIIKSSDEGEALWVDPIELLGEQCTFRDYNRNVMEFFGLATQAE